MISNPPGENVAKPGSAIIIIIEFIIILGLKIPPDGKASKANW